MEKSMNDELMLLPKGDLLRAAAALGVALSSNRIDTIADELAASGHSLTAIKAAMKAPLTPAGVGGQVDAIVAAAVRDAESRIASTVAVMADQVKSLSDLSSIALKGISSANDEIEALKTKPKKSASLDSVRDEVAKLFAPLRDQLDAAPSDVADRVIASAPRERKPIADVFGMPGVEGDCEVWGIAGAFDPDYIFQPEQLKLALLALESGDNFWLWGERGTGKTQFAINLAARLGRPFFRVSFDANLERAEFVGADGLENGATVWRDGAVLKAYRTPGAICLLDEASTCRPEYATTLHALLEPASEFMITSTGEKVCRAYGMCFVAADNTNATGDSSGRYAGTRSQNAALIDRFAFTEKVTFLPVRTEIALLVKHGCDAAIAARLINVFTRCRAEVGGLLVEPPSLRSAFAFGRYINVLSPERTWEVTVVNKSPEESHESLRQLFAAHW